MENARGYEKLAINLQEHIRFYKPDNWNFPINNVAFIPLFSKEDVQKFFEEHKINKLQSKLEELGQDKKFPYCQLNPWYIRKAIEDFFNKQLYSNYETELE